MTAQLHAVTVDVEEYFQVEALAQIINRSEWDLLESRVVWQTERLLTLFEREQVRATFFTLGWICRKHPDLIRRIVREGHELACHGDAHKMITQMSPEEFREDIATAKEILEDTAGVAVDGYRAPTFSVVRETKWALDVMRDVGFRYDASIFPIRHDRYGIPDAPRWPHRIEHGHGKGLVEFPSTTLRVLGRNLPVGGGGYLRLLPMEYTRMALQHLAQQGPCMVYLHPWEIDALQPRFGLGRLATWRSYHNLNDMELRLSTLLKTLPFGTTRDVLQRMNLLA
jgi:polysaccharide deacetylase family protein (PEP-CTERM system associated)